MPPESRTRLRPGRGYFENLASLGKRPQSCAPEGEYQEFATWNPHRVSAWCCVDQFDHGKYYAIYIHQIILYILIYM
jgi:hypothetical protein